MSIKDTIEYWVQNTLPYTRSGDKSGELEQEKKRSGNYNEQRPITTWTPPHTSAGEERERPMKREKEESYERRERRERRREDVMVFSLWDFSTEFASVYE